MKQNLILSSAAVLLVLSGMSVYAQQDAIEDQAPGPCNQPQADEFDFWVGQWNLEWGDGKTGTNVIEKTLAGCVIMEKFDGATSIPLRGMSLSSYNSDLGKWQQTWVDNQGGYLDFVGEYEDSRMVLKRDTMIEGKPVKQRMIWYDIEDDSLNWNWERSMDGGETWEVLWEIRYRRIKAP